MVQAAPPPPLPPFRLLHPCGQRFRSTGSVGEAFLPSFGTGVRTAITSGGWAVVDGGWRATDRG